MPGKQTRKRIKLESEIKQEEDDGEWQNCTTPRRCTEEPGGEKYIRSDVNNGSQRGGEGGGGRTRNKESTAEKALGKRKIKVEEEEEEEEEEGEWSDEDEPSESDISISDPDYDPEGCLSDDSGDDLCKNRSTDRGDPCKQSNANVTGDHEGSELRWEFRSAPDDKPDPLRFKPARTVGPALDTTASWTPLSVFQLFFSTSVIRKIIENTNKNGTWRKRSMGMKKWTEITVKEFYMYLITVLYTSLVKLHNNDDYWKKSWFYSFKLPGDTISRCRFNEIRIALLLCDPEKDEENESKKGTPEYDRQFQIQPFFTELVNACKAHFQPDRNICVHERKMRKNKPLKCGYRLFALVDSSTGYTWNLYIDTGKTVTTRGQTAGYTAVQNLLPVSVIGSGYTLYTDGLFTSPRLFTELLDKNISCCGILSKKHSEFPQNAQNDFPAPQASRGDIRWLRKDKLLFVKWMDTREVAMCSTVHEAFTGQVIKRPVKVGKGWIPKQFSCPDTVNDFNRNMVVADNSDFTYCMPNRRVLFWHRIMFYHLLDLAVVNSYILYKEVMKVRGELTQPITQKMFRERLCKEMYKFAKGCDPNSASAPETPSLCMPMYYVHGSATFGRRNCKLCHKKTPIYCQKCLIPLCLTAHTNCFKNWHEHDSDED